MFLSNVVARLLKYWLPVLIWMLFVFGASTSLGTPQHTGRFIVPFLRWLNPHMTDSTIQRIHHGIRKMGHLSEYCVFGILVLRLIHDEPAFARTSLGRQMRLALLCSALYAASDEFHQLFVPGRESAIRDVLLDTSGAALGIFIFRLACRPRTQAA